MQIINQIQMSLWIIIFSYDLYRHVSASLVLHQCVGLSSDGRPTVFAPTVPSFRIHLHHDVPAYFLLHLYFLPVTSCWVAPCLRITFCNFSLLRCCYCLASGYSVLSWAACRVLMTCVNEFSFLMSSSHHCKQQLNALWVAGRCYDPTMYKLMKQVY